MNKTRSHKLNSMTSVLRAIKQCRAKPLGDPQRIIVLLVPPGFALPPLDPQALRRRGAVLVHAGRMDTLRLRFLKLVVHRTRVVPLLLASVEAWRDWNRRQTLAAAQIRRRTHLVVELGTASSNNY